MKISVIITGSLRTWKHLIVPDVPKGIPFEVPVPCFLLEHKGKKYLFDAGQRPPSAPQRADSNFIIQMKDEERAVCQLARLGIAPEDLECVILSHGHGDHISGLRDLPGVTVCLQEGAESSLPDLPVRKHLLRGETDISGDGAVVALPTPGHAPGHQSLLLTPDDGRKVLLCADAVYTPETLHSVAAKSGPPEKFTPFEQTVLKLLEMQKNGVRLITGHDPETLYKLAENGI